ncbi:hypothetical protein BsWGS_04588 [Bradybaena similaris]
MVVKKDIGNVDSALEAVGSFGRYTAVQFTMQILAWICMAHQMLSIVFTGQKNPFRCIAPSHESLFHQNGTLLSTNLTASNISEVAYGLVCQSAPETLFPSNSSTCNAYTVEYQLPKDRFFVSEFDLVCEREYLAGLTQTLLTLGHAIGALSFPYFADNHGRKPVLLLCAVLWLGSALALAFSVNYTMFAIFKTLGGIFLQGVSQTSATVVIEILTGKQRGFMFACLSYICWTMGTILMIPVAYALREHSWRTLELAYCSYFFFVILYFLFLDESLRWLAANGLKERVVWVLKKASRWNGANFEQVLAAFYKEDETELTQYNEKQQQTSETPNGIPAIDNSTSNGGKDNSCNGEHETHFESEPLKSPDIETEHLNFLSLFTKRHLKFYTAFCIMAWFFNSLTYYGLFLMSSTLSGSIYLNYFLNCAVELPSAIFIYVFIDRLGRKMCLSTFSFTAGISLVGLAITAAVYSPQNIVITVLAIIGKFGISGSFATIYTMTPELLPTTIRNTGFGLANMSACVGGMLAPFADLLMTKVVYGPGLIFGSGSLVLGVWAFFLPETANRQLPQSLEDIDNWFRGPKTTRSMCSCFKANSKKSSQTDKTLVGSNVI